MNTYTVDLETTIVKVGKEYSSSPFVGAKIVCVGFKEHGGKSRITYHPKFNTNESKHADALLVGHNIKFDLLHLKKAGWKDDNVTVWDTQVVEYLLSGQQIRMPSLDDLCLKYGLPTKDKQVTEYFDRGLGADHVPEKLLNEYLKHDLEVTEAIFDLQLGRAKELGMLPLIRSQMGALLALVDIEYNGMFVDKTILEDYNFELLEQSLHLEEELFDEAADYLGHLSDYVDLNLSSRQQIATLLYGGTFTTVRITPVLDDEGRPVEYKTGPRKGTIKTKKVTVEEAFAGILPAALKKNPSHTESGRIQMDEAALLKLSTIPFVAKLLKYYSLSKDISTYSGPYLEYIENSVDGKIHPTYNQAIAVTGRLTCSSPNLQNVSNVDEH